MSSAERLREELLRTLAAPGAGEATRQMDAMGLLSALMPELDAARDVDQPREHYYDVFGHLVAAVDYADQIVANRYEMDFVAHMMPRFDDMEGRYFAQEVSDGHTRGTHSQADGAAARHCQAPDQDNRALRKSEVLWPL